MKKTASEDGSMAVPEFFSRCFSVNRKAKMVLELLGFRSAAALPGHLHAAVLQLLLMGPVALSSIDSTTQCALPRTEARLIPLSSDGCVVQCLFADWLTKISKWLKVPRSRYVMLLAVMPESGPEQQLALNASSSRGTKPAAVATLDSAKVLDAPTLLPGAKRLGVHRRPTQLLLVTFKASQRPLFKCDGEVAGHHSLGWAEPSEVFRIDSSHKALCRLVFCGRDSKRVLVVEGLGGRLLVLGELSNHVTSFPATDEGRACGIPRLERLAYLINANAPFCASPRPPRWRRLLQLFAATATAVDLGTPTAVLAFGFSDMKHHARVNQAPVQKAPDDINSFKTSYTHWNQTYAPAALGEQQRIPLLAVLLRLSISACLTVCRTLSFVMRLPYARTVSPQEPCTEDCNATRVALDEGHSSYTWSPSSRIDFEYRSCVCLRRAHGSRVGNSGHLLPSAVCAARPTRTLRQLIDDQQRAVAALAIRERCQKAAMLQQEHRLLDQQASRALMDEHGQLFPQWDISLHGLTWIASVLHCARTFRPVVG
ncbi:hypothetical protein, conserved [Eimeria necatrix]|uniref:Uncharacterized protein n=1 Tax=Eimeria necatrix TaxID=51315 RepID=U6N118_9EIME|nr:hypothetical protein, conserved [Eimeria necatrix]CDJ67615.1 hypothetical protein, conserved [Eimeria necatrix]